MQIYYYSTFKIFTNISTQQTVPDHVATYRVFILMRNIVFTIQLTYEVVQLMIQQLSGDRSPETQQLLQLSSALLLSISSKCWDREIPR